MQSIELKEIISDQREIITTRHPIIAREVFSQVDAFHQNKQIIIMMGIRRCGKSTLLQAIRERSAERDYYINFDDDRLATFQLADFQLLMDTFHELYGQQKIFYLDEIQNIPEWERFVRRLYDQGNKVYITGSNASMFSKELGTRLTGRYLPIHVYPFSFREFVTFSDPEALNLAGYATAERARLKRLFQSYCERGGLPEYLQINQKEYLHTLYENILYKDVITRYRISSEKTVKNLVYYLASNIAKDTSFNSLRKMLGVGNASTISEYCHYLESSFLCFMINRYNPSLKQQFGYTKKTYFIDIALAKAIGFRFSEDRGRLFENIVFLELLRNDGEIYFYREKQECDFIVKKDTDITRAIQVCVSLQNKKAYDREINGLLAAMDRYKLHEGYILTENEEQELKLKHAKKEYLIHIMPLYKWLLASDE